MVVLSSKITERFNILRVSSNPIELLFNEEKLREIVVHVTEEQLDFIKSIVYCESDPELEGPVHIVGATWHFKLLKNKES